MMVNFAKIHVALNVSDLERSVNFYRTMFGAKPVKWKPGYAKFNIAEPPLNLSLNYSSETMSRGALNHLGIKVRDTDEVLATKNRLSEAGPGNSG